MFAPSLALCSAFSYWLAVAFSLLGVFVFAFCRGRRSRPGLSGRAVGCQQRRRPRRQTPERTEPATTTGSDDGHQNVNGTDRLTAPDTGGRGEEVRLLRVHGCCIGAASQGRAAPPQRAKRSEEPLPPRDTMDLNAQNARCERGRAERVCLCFWGLGCAAPHQNGQDAGPTRLARRDGAYV